MPMHLLDANVLITAKNLYYPLNRIPEFWDWLIHKGNEGAVKIPPQILQEIKTGNDDLSSWVSEKEVSDALTLLEDVNAAEVRRVTNQYAPDLNDAEIYQIGQDPFLIAYALAAVDDRVVVTVEASKPTLTRANRRIPDVCSDLGISCCNTFEMLRQLNFSTDWRP